MRVVIFVPVGRGTIHTWRTVAYGADLLGHEVVGEGPISSSAEIRVILDLHIADMVACRPKHLELLDPDLQQRALVVQTPRTYRTALAGVVALPWLVEQFRHPARLAAGAALAGIAAAAVLLAPRDDPEQPPGAVAPPQLSPTAQPSQPPGAAPSTRPPPSSPRPRTAARATDAPAAQQSTAPRPPAITPVVRPSQSPPAASPVTASPTPTCIISADLLDLLHIRLCAGGSSS